MPLENIEIIGAARTKEKLAPAELDRLVRIWMDETYQPLNAPASGMEGLFEAIAGNLPNGVTAVIQNIREKMLKYFPQLSKTHRQQKRHTEQFRLALTAHLSEAIERGDMVIATKNNRAIGMVRVNKLTQPAPNKFTNGDVYEIGKALVVPEERGKGVYRELRKLAITQLREKCGDVAILTGTKNAGVKKINREDGWVEIGFDNYLRIHGYNENHVQAQSEASLKDGWTAFLYLPKKTGADTSGVEDFYTSSSADSALNL